jgi:hypothetical protein
MPRRRRAPGQRSVWHQKWRALSGVFLNPNPSLCSFSFQKTNTGQVVKFFNPKKIGTLTGALTTHTPEGAYSGADSAQNVYRYNMTEHMLQQYALDNQRDILAVSKGDTAAEKRVIIDLRNYSTSVQESKARWTIDIIGNKDINKVSILTDNKFEIKFR